MATTYGDLKAAVADFINRTDASPQLIERSIQVALQRIYRTLRIPSMERLATVTLEAGENTIPIVGDMLEVKSLYGDRGPLERKSLDWLVAQPEATGYPAFFARQVDSHVVYPTPDRQVTLRLVYYEEFTPLQADTDTNNLLQVGFDALLFGALTYLGEYFSDKRVAQWEVRFNEAVQAIQHQADGAEYAGITSIQPLNAQEY